MIIQIKPIILVLLIHSLAGQFGYSQDYRTRNNYTGAWETPASWVPTWPIPQNNVYNSDITINGYITANNSLSFSGFSSNLIVDDTLVINGNLIIDDNNDLLINNNGILIVRGNLIFSDHSRIEANNYIIVTGNIIKFGPTNHGKFTSDDDPALVFVGGAFFPANLTDNEPDYPALDCISPSDPYPHSGCSYGDMTDIITDPIYPFFQSTCVTATITSSYVNNSFCAGTSVTFTAGGGTSYNFRINGTSVQNGGSATFTTTTLTNGTIVDVIVTGTNGCTALSAGITNTVFDLPLAMANSNSPVCAGSPLTLTGSPAGMRTYSWTGPNGFASLLQDPSVSTNATLVMGGMYILTVTNANGCIDTMTQSVIVSENPIAIAGPDQQLEYIFETQMKAELSSSETGEWSLISGSGRISDVHSPTSLVTELSSGENIFLWKVQNTKCEATAEVKITVQDLFIPSVITPNGDGKNDYFIIGRDLAKAYLIIINRWGNEEYTNEDYKNDWDGRNKKGENLPDDTYFYILKLDNGRIEKGSVLIKR